MKNEILNSRDLKKKLKKIKEARKESNKWNHLGFDELDQYDSRGESKRGTLKPDFKNNQITKSNEENKGENLAEMIFRKNHEIRKFLNSELTKVEDDLKKKFPDNKKENYFG